MGVPGPNGHWPVWLSVTFHTANLLTSFHLMAVPVILASLWAYRRDGIEPKVYWRVMCLFPFLALARLARFAELAGPPYHLTTMIDVAATISTAYSVSAMPRVIRHVLLLPSRKAVHDLNNRLNAANLVLAAERSALADRNARLLLKLTDLTNTLAVAGWSHEKEIALRDMREMLAKGGPGGN